jgi:hypothetical protein
MESFYIVGGEYKLVQPIWKIEWTFFKNLKLKLPYDPAMLLLDMCPKDLI